VSVTESEPKMDLSRPSPLRLAGFLAVAIGGLFLGVGSALNWAVVGFVGSHALDVQTRGVDVWEGKVTLAIGVLVLLGIVAMRISAKGSVRRAAAIAITLVGLFASGLMVATVIRGKDRFADQSELGKIATQLSKAGAGPVADILRSLQANFAEHISFSRGLSLWLTLAGSLLAAIGGILSLRWVDRQESQRLSAAAVEGEEVEAPDDAGGDDDRR
jgi:hypothetical protein